MCVCVIVAIKTTRLTMSLVDSFIYRFAVKLSNLRNVNSTINSNIPLSEKSKLLQKRELIMQI